MSKIDLSSQVTLVIPTFNRHRSLLRVLQFYLSYDILIPIKVLDSSEQEVSDPQLKKVLQSKQITYEKFDPECTIYKKIFEGTKEVKTPYIHMCADDDFIFLDALPVSISFLEQNPDFSVAKGFEIAHYYSENKLFWHSVQSRSVTQNCPLDRLHDHFTQRNPGFFYSLQRTLIFQNAYKEVINSNLGLFTAEIFLECFFKLQGKAGILPILQISRESHFYSPLDSNFILQGFSPEKLNQIKRPLIKSIEKLNLEPEAKKIEKQIQKELENYYFLQKLHLNSLSIKTKSYIDIIRRISEILKLKEVIIGALQLFHHPRYMNRKKIIATPNFKGSLTKLKKCINSSYAHDFSETRKTYVKRAI